jgi:ABC-type Na+ efflux pump permease subunit
MATDPNRITTDLVVKLFDTLKDSHKHLEDLIEKQTISINYLTSSIKDGVKTEEIKKIVETHGTTAISTLNEIDTCTETIKGKSTDILDVINMLHKKITVMIVIICTAFSLMTISYIFVSNSMDKMVYEKITKAIEVQVPKTINDRSVNDIFKELESIRKEINKFHGENR